MGDAAQGDAAPVSIYVLPLRNGTVYVGKTTDAARRNAQHRSPVQRPCAWVRRHGPAVADLRVLETVAARHGSGAEDRVTAQQLWTLGPNAARGGQLAGNTEDFTLDDLVWLTRFIAHLLDKPFNTVEQQLRSQLSPSPGQRPARTGVGGGNDRGAAALVQRRCEDGCGERTARPQFPLCSRCYVRRKQDNTLWESDDDGSSSSDDSSSDEEEEESEEESEEEQQDARHGRPPAGSGRYHPYGRADERCQACGAEKRNGGDKPLCYPCWRAHNR